MRIRKREIARTGIFGTMEKQQIVTKRDIKEIEETFLDVCRAPVQFGHHTIADAPRLGNVISVYSDNDGNSLYADIEEHDTLAKAVDAGFYPDVSIGARQRAKDGKMYLHHLAYLGQEPPAIKNLIAKIKEPLGITATDTDVDGLVFLPPICDLKMNLSETIKPKKEKLIVTKEEADKLREENEHLKNELQKRDIALSDSIKQQTDVDIVRLKTAMNGARINKVMQEQFLQIACAFEPGKIIELADGSGGTQKMNAIDALIKTVSAIPQPVQTGAFDLSDQSQRKRDFSTLRNKG